MLWQIDTGYACGGIITDEDLRIIKACPIFRWMIGKYLPDVSNWKKIKTIALVA